MRIQLNAAFFCPSCESIIDNAKVCDCGSALNLTPLSTWVPCFQPPSAGTERWRTICKDQSEVTDEQWVIERTEPKAYLYMEGHRLFEVRRRIRDPRPQYAHHYFELSDWFGDPLQAWADAATKLGRRLESSAPRNPDKGDDV